FLRRLRTIHIKLSTVAEIFRVHPDFSICPRRASYVSAPVDRNRQNKAIVVISVLADDVDATGGREDARHLAIAVGTFLTEGDEIDHGSPLVVNHNRWPS